MIEGRKCVRCHKELDIFGFYKDAFCYEEEKLYIERVVLGIIENLREKWTQ